MDLSNVNEKLHEAGQKISDEAKGLKDKLVAKLSEENAQSPAQRLKNATASLDGAKAVEKAAKADLQEARDTAEKYKRYAASAEAKGDSAGVRKFEDALSDILEKLPSLENAYQAAVAKTKALDEIVQDFADALNPQKPTVEETPTETMVEDVSVLSEPVSEAIQAPDEPMVMVLEGQAATEGAEGGL